MPDPHSVLITKILPQDLCKKGINEYYFAREIYNIFLKKDTCIVGFNNLKFDNLITRNIFYRNCLDPYEWCWKNGNSSWDILNVLRAFYIFYPNNILWPKNTEGHIIFKLSEFTKINNILHRNVHDASSDVFATIEVAKLLCSKNKKFFFMLYIMSKKNNIRYFIHKNYHKPFFYLSSIFGSKRNNISCVMIFGYHPKNNNLLLIFDLERSLKDLVLLYEKSNKINYTIKDLLLVGIKIIYLNQSPMFFKYNSLSVKSCQRLNLNYYKYQKKFFFLLNKKDIKKWILSIFLIHPPFPLVLKSKNIDLMLYYDFFHSQDKVHLNLLHKKSPEYWNITNLKFYDHRLYKIIFRLRARNFFNSLTILEKQSWKKHCQNIIRSEIIKQYFHKIDSLKILYNDDYEKVYLLNQLAKYVNQLIKDINNFC